MNMGVDTNPWFAKSKGDHQVGCFPANSLEGQEFVDTVGDVAIETFQDPSADLQDGGCLGPVETGGINGLGDGLYRNMYHLVWCTGELEQPCTCPRGDFVLGSQADQARDTNPVGIRFVVFRNLGDRSGAA